MTTNSPLYLQNVFTFKNLPVQQKQRKWTDFCCTILMVLLVLTLVIMSLITFHKHNYGQVNFPADDLGKICYHQLKQYRYLYFANITNLTQGRFCLKSCPIKGQTIQCPNQIENANCKSLQSDYETVQEKNNIGAFCSPKDESARNKLFSQVQLGPKLTLTYGYDMIRFSLFMGALVGLLYLSLVGCISKWMTLISFGLAFLVLLASGIYIYARPVHLFWSDVYTYILAAILIIIGILYLAYMACFRKEIQLAGIFMKHSNDFLRQSFLVYLYIPLFLLLTILFLGLIYWQYIAFGTAHTPTFDTKNIYYHSKHNIVLQVLNILQLIWGLQFLRDAFNFVVSGNSVQWYFKNVTESRHCGKPFVRLLTKHLGSVVGGSFLNAFFKIFDIFADFFHCDPRGKFGKCQTIYQKLCCCNYIFQLIRTDSYSYINLTGIAYCNAARQCEALCRYSPLIKNPHSCLRAYRNAAHIFTIGLGALLSYIILDAKTNQYGNYDHFWVAGAIVIACYSTGTYFVDIHQNGAQALMISYLTQQNCQGQQYMEVCPGQLRQDLYDYKLKYEVKQEPKI